MEDKTIIATQRQGDTWLVQISGELTKAEEDRFFQTYPWLSGEQGICCILFDLTKLHYINSAGISLFIRFVREAQRKKFGTYAFGVSSHYQKIFRIVGLTAYLELFPDQYSAIETLQARSSFEKADS